MTSTVCQRLEQALYRQKKCENPLPKNHDDLMKADIPASLSQTANGGEFLFKHAWINEVESQNQ
jgi:hypothetical protein